MSASNGVQPEVGIELPPAVVLDVGLRESIVLLQIHALCQDATLRTKGKDEHWWVCITYLALKDKYIPYLSLSSVHRIIRWLVREKLLFSAKLHLKGRTHSTHYRPNYSHKWLVGKLQP